MKVSKSVINYLNRHRDELYNFPGKVTCYGLVCWANKTTREIYAHSEDAEISGVINGCKIADIDDDWRVVVVHDDK